MKMCCYSVLLLHVVIFLGILITWFYNWRVDLSLFDLSSWEKLSRLAYSLCNIWVIFMAFTYPLNSCEKNQ